MGIQKGERTMQGFAGGIIEQKSKEVHKLSPRIGSASRLRAPLVRPRPKHVQEILAKLAGA
jgi:hypothetical protein